MVDGAYGESGDHAVRLVVMDNEFAPGSATALNLNTAENNVLKAIEKPKIAMREFVLVRLFFSLQYISIGMLTQNVPMDRRRIR